METISFEMEHISCHSILHAWLNIHMILWLHACISTIASEESYRFDMRLLIVCVCMYCVCLEEKERETVCVCVLVNRDRRQALKEGEILKLHGGAFENYHFIRPLVFLLHFNIDNALKFCAKLWLIVIKVAKVQRCDQSTSIYVTL